MSTHKTWGEMQAGSTVCYYRYKSWYCTRVTSEVGVTLKYKDRV